MLRRRLARRREEAVLDAGDRRRPARRAAGRRRAGRGRRRRRALLRRPGRRHPRPPVGRGRRLAARLAGAAAGRPGAGRAGRPRLRAARGRQGMRGAGAGPPAHPARRRRGARASPPRRWSTSCSAPCRPRAAPARYGGERSGPGRRRPRRAGVRPGYRVRRWFLGRRAVRTMGWRRTDALARAVACGFGLAVAGVVLHRLELLLIGAPLLVSVLLVTPPTGRPRVRAALLANTPEAGRTNGVSVPCSRATARRSPRCGCRCPRGPASARCTCCRRCTAPSACGSSGASWGQADYLRPDHLLASHDGLYVYGPIVGRTASHTVLPPIEPLPTAPLPPRAAGLVGAHRSARARATAWSCGTSGRSSPATGCAGSTGGCRCEPRRPAAARSYRARCTSGSGTRSPTPTWCSRWTPPPTSAAGSPVVRGRPGRRGPRGRQPRPRCACGVLAGRGVPAAGRPGRRSSTSATRAATRRRARAQRQLQRIRHSLVLAAQRVAARASRCSRASQYPRGATVVVLSPFLDDRGHRADRAGRAERGPGGRGRPAAARARAGPGSAVGALAVAAHHDRANTRSGSRYSPSTACRSPGGRRHRGRRAAAGRAPPAEDGAPVTAVATGRAGPAGTWRTRLDHARCGAGLRRVRDRDPGRPGRVRRCDATSLAPVILASIYAPASPAPSAVVIGARRDRGAEPVTTRCGRGGAGDDPRRAPVPRVLRIAGVVPVRGRLHVRALVRRRSASCSSRPSCSRSWAWPPCCRPRPIPGLLEAVALGGLAW